MEKFKTNRTKGLLLIFLIFPILAHGVSQSKVDSLFFRHEFTSESITNIIRDFQNQLEKLELIGDNESEVYFLCQLRLGQYFSRLGSSIISKKHFEKVNEILKKKDEPFYKFQHSFILGKVNFYKQEYDKALGHLKTADIFSIHK